MKFNNETIRVAVREWIEDENKAKEKYGDINDWNTSEVTDMSKLFLDANEFNSSLGSWDVSNVKTMHAMFDNAFKFDQNINNWDVSNVEDMSEMFSTTEELDFNQPLDNWDVSSVTNMSYMFYSAKSFNQPLDKWDVSNVIYMREMFSGAESFNQPIDKWDVSKVTDMHNMFFDAKSFNQTLYNWDVSRVTDMSYMFRNATSFNQPLNNWDISKVTDMSCMFMNATSFNQSLDKWNINNFTKTEDMFYGSKKINHSVDKLDMDNTEDEFIDSDVEIDRLKVKSNEIYNQSGKYYFDGWDKDFVNEQIEEEPTWYENNHNGKTLSMFLSIVNIHFSSHPRINELGYQVDNNFNDFLKLYEKCFQVEFEMPKELKKHISLKKHDLELTEAFQGGKNYLTFDFDCNLTFEIKTNYDEAKSVIDKFQEKNYDLRWNISVYWNYEK